MKLETTIRFDKVWGMLRYVRTAPREWQKLHVYNYLHKVGPIQKNYIFIPLSDDTLNADLSNWKLVSRREYCLLKQKNEIKGLKANISKDFLILKIRKLNDKERGISPKNISADKERKVVKEKFGMGKEIKIPKIRQDLKEVKIPELKMSVWVKPHRMEKEVRAKFLKR